jgi:hypothetical protein
VISSFAGSSAPLPLGRETPDNENGWKTTVVGHQRLSSALLLSLPIASHYEIPTSSYFW